MEAPIAISTNTNYRLYANVVPFVLEALNLSGEVIGACCFDGERSVWVVAKPFIERNLVVNEANNFWGCGGVHFGIEGG